MPAFEYERAEAIRLALSGYDGCDLEPDEVTSYEAARARTEGDTLRDFIVLELTDGIEEQPGPPGIVKHRAVRLLEVAMSDLERARNRILEEE